MAPPPPFSGSIEHWEEWSWQLKSYVSLFKPRVSKLLEAVEGKTETIDDKFLDEWEKTNNPTFQLTDKSKHRPYQLVQFSKQLHYLLAQLTSDAARTTVRLNNDGNGFETWRALYDRFSLPDRAWSVNYLSRIIDHKLRDSQFETDLQEFMALKNKHEKATGKKLDDDLLVTLMMAKTSGPLQQHLRLNVDPATTFNQVLQTIRVWYTSRHITGWRGSIASNGPAPMEVDQIGAIGSRGKRGRKGYGKGKGKGNWPKGFWPKGFSKGRMKGEGNWNWRGSFGKGKGKSKGKGKGKAKAKAKERAQVVSIVVRMPTRVEIVRWPDRVE